MPRRIRREPTPSAQALKQAAMDRYSMSAMQSHGVSSRNKNKDPVDVKPLMALAARQLQFPLRFDSHLKAEVKTAFRHQFLEGGWEKMGEEVDLTLDSFLCLLVSRFFDINENQTYPRPFAFLLLFEAPIFVTALGIEWGRSDSEFEAVAEVQKDMFITFPLLKTFLLPGAPPCQNVAQAMNTDLATIETRILEATNSQEVDRAQFIRGLTRRRKNQKQLALARDFRRATKIDVIGAASRKHTPGLQYTEHKMWVGLVDSLVLQTERQSLSKLLAVTEVVARRALLDRIQELEAQHQEMHQGLLKKLKESQEANAELHLKFVQEKMTNNYLEKELDDSVEELACIRRMGITSGVPCFANAYLTYTTKRKWDRLVEKHETRKRRKHNSDHRMGSS